MGYRLNCLDQPVFIAVSKPLLTEFGNYLRLESCGEESMVRVPKLFYQETSNKTRCVSDDTWEMQSHSSWGHSTGTTWTSFGTATISKWSVAVVQQVHRLSQTIETLQVSPNVQRIRRWILEFGNDPLKDLFFTKILCTKVSLFKVISTLVYRS